MIRRFVGRVAELDAIGALVRRARTDRMPTSASIVGEPGSGKTTLLAEVVAQSAPTKIVRVAGFELMESVPLAAAGELLRALTKAPGHGPLLDQLVFQRASARDRDPLQIFEAAHRALASVGPIIIAIDDLQWVDQRSVALIHYLLRAAVSTRKPIAVVVASRPSPGAASYRASIETDLPSDRRVDIDLGPLSLDDGLSLARAVDPDLDESAATGIWRRARGSPFWLEALARERTTADPSSLISDRLRNLTADAAALLATLAVGSRPVTDEEAAALLDWKIDRAHQASRELIARGLVVTVGGANRVSHDLIREAAAAALPEAARRRLHGRIGAWIEDNAGDDLGLLREALVHRQAADMSGVPLAGRLLASPQRRLLRGDDLKTLATIADALDQADPTRRSLDRSIAELAAVLGEQELALDRWTRTIAGEADPLERIRAGTEAARAAYELRRAADAHHHIQRARTLTAALAEPTFRLAAEIRLDALQAEVELWVDLETAAGARSAGRALANARDLASASGGIDGLSLDGRRAYLEALSVACDAAMQEDRAADVMELSRAILEVAQGLDPEAHIAALIRTGFALNPFGDVAGAEARYRQAWDLSRQRVLPFLMVEAGTGLASSLGPMGRLTEARAVALETAELEARIGNAPQRWGTAALLVHEIDLVVGDPAVALRALREGAVREPNPHFRWKIHAEIAQWEARFGGIGAASSVEAQLDAAADASRQAGCPRCAGELLIVAAEAQARIGLVRSARDKFADWDQGVIGDYLQRHVWRTHATAAIASAEGDHATASSQLEALIEKLEPTGIVDDLLWARIDLGRALGQTDRARGIEVLVKAAQLAEQIGARSHARLIAQELRRLGVRAWRRTGSSTGAGLDGLSEREREVAELIADGNSNREIADALLISAKTVERHVTNVLAKLGLRNRTQVASLVRAAPVRVSPDE